MVNPKDIRIGMILIHRDKGEITVRGISPHCRDYKIDTDESWVYLKNCKVVKDSLTTQTVEDRRGFPPITMIEDELEPARRALGNEGLLKAFEEFKPKIPQTVEERALELYPDEAYRNAIEVRKAYIKGATDKNKQ
jgi:hypothetical protein